MATSKGYFDFISDQLSVIEQIEYRRMMGEYIVYYRGKISAYLCDDRLLVKPVPSAIKMMPDAEYESPYEGAKEMLPVKNTDDKEFLCELFRSMYDELPEPKKRRK